MTQRLVDPPCQVEAEGISHPNIKTRMGAAMDDGELKADSNDK